LKVLDLSVLFTDQRFVRGKLLVEIVDFILNLEIPFLVSLDVLVKLSVQRLLLLKLHFE